MSSASRWECLARGMLRCCAMAVLTIALAGCSKAPPDNAPVPAPVPVPASAATTPSGDQPWITAEPNPVPISSGKGSTTISWSAGAGNKGEVYLWTASGGESLFAGEAPKGSQQAGWVSPGGVYEFRLYEGKERKRQLASVKVTGEAQKYSASAHRP
jgi:hypothetical protein